MLGDFFSWLWFFWLWCCKINLGLMLWNDLFHNKWSTPREYAGIIIGGPITLAIVLHRFVTKLCDTIFAKKTGD